MPEQIDLAWHRRPVPDPAGRHRPGALLAEATLDKLGLADGAVVEVSSGDPSWTAYAINTSEAVPTGKARVTVSLAPFLSKRGRLSIKQAAVPMARDLWVRLPESPAVLSVERPGFIPYTTLRDLQAALFDRIQAADQPVHAGQTFSVEHLDGDRAYVLSGCVQRVTPGPVAQVTQETGISEAP